MSQVKILKFGGTSVRDAESIRQTVSVIRAAGPTARAVVVSAMGGVTDALLDVTRRAERRGDESRRMLEDLERRHLETAVDLASASERETLVETLESMFGDLGDLVHGIHLLREASARTRDAVVGYGERLSSLIVAAALRADGIEARAVDARTLIVTDDSFGAARVDPASTEARIRDHFASANPASMQVVPGFVAATAEGQSTTLGRGGSDYTAALLGAALDADSVELWTDVDAVMSADPRIVPGARPIRHLSYLELLELCHFGAKVVHPPAIHPSRAKGIPLHIRNTFNPDSPFTTVTANARVNEPGAADSDRAIRGITSIAEVALVRLEGDGMVGVPGIAGRLFSALSASDVNVILITQASSEHSICFAIEPDAVGRTERAIDEAFALERRLGLVDSAVVERDLSVVAVVGAGMRDRPGIAGRVFGALGEAGISVRAIAQGSSELNISMIVDAESRDDAVRALHDSFIDRGRAPRRATEPLRVAVAGVGGVGGALLGMLARRAEDADARPRLRLVALGGRAGWIADSDGVDPQGGIDPSDGVARLRRADAYLDVDRMLESSRPDVFVDATASHEVAALYDRMLDRGTSVVTANKLRLAGPSDEAAILDRRAGRLFFETTVGAGLPVVGTLESLLDSGDRVHRIEATLSGTLGFLTSETAAGRTLSEALRDAFERGYTEPDPRQDLGGGDAARKLLILSRVIGDRWHSEQGHGEQGHGEQGHGEQGHGEPGSGSGPKALEPEDVSVTRMMPESVDSLSLDDFWQWLPELDAGYRAGSEAAAAKGCSPVFLGTLDPDGARLGLRAIPADHPCAAARGTDNVFVITTDRYLDSPLVIRGPGAGTEVTAAGLLADILRAGASK